VQKLSAILRIADGLDYSHDSCVDSLACDIRSDKVIIRLKTKCGCSAGIRQALKKADLFQQIYGRNVEFQEK
jgi:exopolyphosphatase/guanosine-5'-triphosphate,3'-diphosphate pyrophosphatase